MFGEKYVLLLIFCVQFNPAQSQTRGAVIPTTRPPTSCQLYQATCNNGDCIDRSQVCNGVIDCADGSDESGCRASNECEPNEYQCENKKCVLKTWRCDGDDDCGDGTDEQNCQETDPSNPCRFYEWQCSSGDQCIPKSFHCDGEMDCQDQSDEIGCTGPVIVISPPPAVLVDQSYTFIINCTAMGIPTPEVVWRLNWGHVPEKCRMTNQVQEGNRAYGELTCTNAQKEDSGAYSCEAINSMGSCFAGSAGCGQPGQDAIVVVNAGNSVCPSGYFNNLAVTREDCLPCYCSELSDTCSSADLYFSKLPPPAGIFQLISRDPVTLSTVLIRRLTPEIKSVSSQRLYLLNKSMLEDKGVPYFSMPNSHTGNLLKSYGGYLKFSLSYAGEGNLINEPMIIIQGENNMLVYYPEPEPRPGVENRIEVRFWPGDWFTDYKNGNRASREDILRVLSNVKYLLLKAQQVDSGPIDTTISDISMDSADTRDGGAGSAVYIEQCVCPPGYTGLSCESCSPGYERSSSGTCRRPSETCPTGYYADPDTGECNVCPCPLTTPSNQFGRECRVDTDRQVTCVCATGYTGRRCGDCSPGYVGNPALPGGSCTPDNCREGFLQCYDGYSICSERRCDGNPDCSEGEDELGCEIPEFSEDSKPGGVGCGEGMYMCENNVCIENSMVCDGTPQCRDLSDETNCDIPLFTCCDGGSIPAAEQCNGFRNCRDGSDEFYCSQDKTCSGLEFTCGTGDCIPLELRCNGYPDCRDGSDEACGCNSYCTGEKEHRCKNNLCAEKCDGMRDCQDGSDEINCPVRDCGRFDWNCGEGYCIPQSMHCDGISQCPDMSDEKNCRCGVSEFRCGDGACIQAGKRCDGRYDCRDYSDEDSCLGCRKGEWMCNDGLCIPEYLRCDDVFQCRDLSDETNCPLCAENEKECDGVCILPQQICDGRADCRDGSDEENCPVCNYPDGSFDRSPNPTTGRCRCKAGYTGEDCNQAELSGCGDYKFLSREESVPGCINCFCMGVPTRSNRTTCQPSQLYRYKERAVFQEDHLGFSLTDRNLEYNINSSDLILSTERQEISYDRFDEDPETIYYWKLPHQFLGNKLTSYGGYLEFILRHIPTPGSEPTVGSPLIEIQGNDVVLIHDSAPILETNSGHKFKVRIHEKDWKRFDGGDTNREHLLMALANLDHILIRASHSPATREGGIADVSLECAVNRTTGGGRATAVEGCICPRGYKGLSCEDCAPGYTRSGSGVYLGTCEPCNCNGKSSTCDPENGICLACRDFTVGPSCESCIDGFFKDPRSGGCIPESGSISPCSCDPRGSLDLNCINNQYCQCKENVEGMNCDRCKPGTFNLDYGTPQGCRKCFCSGVTDECSDARLFWSTLRMNAYDKTYLIKDESQQIVKDRELRFDNRTMEISYQISPEESETVYYWELPRDVTGNRLGSYGGNLTIIQRYLSSGRNVLRDPAVIIVGGEVTLVYPESKLEREDGIEKKYKIPILESEWMVGMSRGRETPASREDMLSALSDVKAILVRASVAEQTVETYIRKTMLDIAVPQMTGGPLVQGAEECRCPVGYSGYSCESCALGYYRDWTDRSMGGQGRCVLCPCNNNEDSCSMVSTQEVECICKAGYSGQMCEYRGSTRPDVSGPGEEVPITITMNEPKIQIIEVGNTVRFSCNAIPRFRSQDPMTIAWAKENGLLPAGRASDNGQGLLVITSVRSEDSGTYICTATTGRFVKTETAVLSVEGGESTMAPIASIDPPYQQISVGDRLQMDCRTSGSPTPTVTWSRGRGEPLNPRVIVRGSSLFIGAVGREDEGEYICTASSTGGSTQSRTQIYVTSSGNQENKPQDSSRISVNPQDLAISVGDSAMFICEVSGGENYRISWERMEGRLPFTATESSGRLTISAVRVEDSGIYICQATSSSGAKLESQARLTITSYRGPPSVRIEPEEQTIGQGSSTELRCIGSGEPAPSLEWSKVGEDLSSPNLVVSGGVLSLRNAAVSDRGMYICTAENAGGSARASGIIEVERREPPGVEIYPENSQTITKSGSVLFQCRTIAGIPSPLVTWTRVDGLPLQPNVELLGGGVLRINRVTGKEQGGYKCRAQNEVGSTEAIATLVVQEVPTITLQPKGSVTMQVGTKLSISCSARGDPPPSVSWKKIGMTTRQVGTSSPVFEISRLTKEDEGTYACVARNIAGETEERVQIIVLEEDEFYSYPDQSGGQYPGQNGGRYPDQSGGRYPDQNGERYPDQNEGRYPDQNEGRYPDQSGGRYPDQNEGRYPDQSGEPGGLPLLDNQPVSVGANIRLECMTVGEGASFSGQWKRADGRRFPTRHYQSQGILNLVRVDADDEGVYVCEVVDNRGSVVYEVRKEIILISPPRITLDPQRQTVNPGDSPLITCSATGSEPINILWSREDGSNLPRSVSQSRGRLQFRGISVRDQGRYSCTASNPDGNSVATAEVIVNENSLEDPSDPGYKGYQPPRNPEKGYQPPSAPQPYKGYQPPRPNPMEDRSRGGASGAGLNQPYPDLDQGNAYPQPSYPDSLFYDTEEVDYYDYGRRPEPINPGYSAFPDSPDYERRSEPERLTASIGANIDLPCRLPENHLVTWRRDGGALPPTAQQITNTLRISKVLDQDSGRYICSSEQGGTYVVELRVEPGLECDRMEFECSNKAGCVPKSQLCDGEFDCTDGSDELSCGLYRIRRGIQSMRRNPVVTVEPSSPRIVEGGSLDISCKVAGVESGSVRFSWSKVGSPELPENTAARGNLIRFMNLVGENNGLYRCTAETELGIFYSDYSLFVQSKGQGTGYRPYP